jgi:hypothetical protein
VIVCMVCSYLLQVAPCWRIVERSQGADAGGQVLPNQQTSADDVVAKLKDRDVLRNYCDFSTMYRPSIAMLLIDALDSDPLRRRAIAMEIVALYVAALEDLVLWFFTLRQWRPGEELLFDVVDTVFVNEGRKSTNSTGKALAELANWTHEQLRSEFGLPDDDWLMRNGWSAKGVAEHAEGLTAFLTFVRAALAQRTSDEGMLVTAYNKIKHGALAIAATENSRMGLSLMIPSRRRRGPLEESSGKRMVDVAWLPCDDADLRKLASSVLVTSHVTWVMLNVVYSFRFDPSWEPPKWPFPPKA